MKHCLNCPDRHVGCHISCTGDENRNAILSAKHKAQAAERITKGYYTTTRTRIDKYMDTRKVKLM